MAKKKPGRGGHHKVAGGTAYPEGLTTVIAVSIPKSLLDRLDARAKREHWNRSQTVAEAIRRLVN